MLTTDPFYKKPLLPKITIKNTGIDDNKDGGSPANKDPIVPAALVILCYYYGLQQL